MYLIAHVNASCNSPYGRILDHPRAHERSVASSKVGALVGHALMDACHIGAGLRPVVAALLPAREDALRSLRSPRR